MNPKQKLRQDIATLATQAQSASGHNLKHICDSILLKAQQLRALRAKSWWQPEFWDKAKSHSAKS